MFKNKLSFDLDDYDDDVFEGENEDSEEQSFEDEVADTEEADTNYDYSEYIKIEEDEDLEIGDNDTFQYHDKNSSIKKQYLSIAYKVVTRVGLVISIILLAMFITNGEIMNCIKFVLLLVISFFVGYISMLLYDKLKENN